MQTTKPFSEQSQEQVIKKAQNNDGTLGINGFVAGKVGHKIRKTTVSGTQEDYRFFDIVNTSDATTSSGQPTLTNIVSTLNLLVGQYVFGTDIPDNTTILSIDSQTQVTLSNNATGSSTTTVKFANLLQRLRIEYNNSDHDEFIDCERLD